MSRPSGYGSTFAFGRSLTSQTCLRRHTQRRMRVVVWTHTRVWAGTAKTRKGSLIPTHRQRRSHK
eukprot:3298080-Pleurochrysis_carterae.AAC.4